MQDPKKPIPTAWTWWFITPAKTIATAKSTFEKNGAMRIGSRECYVKSTSKAGKAYGVQEIRERHRHRLEMNNTYRQAYQDAGVLLSGISEDGDWVDIIELPEHPWFLACHFQPEFKSRPNRAHPLFRDFVGAIVDRKRG